MVCDAMVVARYRLTAKNRSSDPPVEVYVHSDHDVPGRYEWGIRGPAPEIRAGVKGGTAGGLPAAVKRAVKLAILVHSQLLQARMKVGDIEWHTVAGPYATVFVDVDKDGNVSVSAMDYLVRPGFKPEKVVPEKTAPTTTGLSNGVELLPPEEPALRPVQTPIAGGN